MFSWSRRKILTFYCSKEILLLLYCARVLSLKYINMIKQNSYKMSISRVPIVILNILKTVSVMFGETKKVRLYLASKIVFVLWKRLRSLTGFQMFYTDLHLRFCFFSNGRGIQYSSPVYANIISSPHMHLDIFHICLSATEQVSAEDDADLYVSCWRPSSSNRSQWVKITEWHNDISRQKLHIYPDIALSQEKSVS